MNKETQSVQFRKLLKYDVTKHTKSWDPVLRNDWMIKFSIYKCFVMVLFTSIHTGQTVIRYFNDEDLACDYINYMIQQDASIELKHP